MVGVQYQVTSPNRVFEDGAHSSFYKKVAPDCLSLRVMPLLWLTISTRDQVDLFGRADVSCNFLCCAARCCLTGECGAECVRVCALSESEVVFSAQVVDVGVRFAEWC